MDNEKLLQLVSKYEFLYNLKHPKYTDNTRKEVAWKEISSQLNQSAGACKQRWQSLRDAFRRVLNKRKRKFLLFGQTPKSSKKWTYESEMEFLAPYFTERKPRESVKVSDDDDSESESVEQEPDHESEPSEQEKPNIEMVIADADDCYSSEISDIDTKSPKVKRKRFEPEQSLTTNLENRNETSRGYDNLDRFFLSISDTVKKFPPYQQALAKNQIFSIVSEMELQQLAPSNSI